jgi:periplasmic protein TonB
VRLAIAVLALSLTLTPQQEVYEVGDRGVTTPVLVKDVKPNYTADALRRKIQGSVLLRGVVLETGRVGEVEIEQSLDSELDQEAVKAFKQWEFRPGMKDGKPVAVRVSCKMAFAVKD